MIKLYFTHETLLEKFDHMFESAVGVSFNLISEQMMRSMWVFLFGWRHHWLILLQLNTPVIFFPAVFRLIVGLD